MEDREWSADRGWRADRERRAILHLPSSRSRTAFLEHFDRQTDITEAIIPGFAFDAERAGVSNVVQRIEELLDADLSMAERDFLTELHSRLVRGNRILRMNVFDVPSEDRYRFDRIT